MLKDFKNKKASPKKQNQKSAQERQDEIFRQMSAEKKLRLTCDFSSFLLKLNQTNRFR